MHKALAGTLCVGAKPLRSPDAITSTKASQVITQGSRADAPLVLNVGLLK